MTSTLRANRRTTVNRLRMLQNAVTSLCLLCTGVAYAQQPPTAQKPAQPPTTEQKNMLALEEEGRYTPPGKDELYRVDSESTLAERIRQLRKATGKTPLDFPDGDNIRIKTAMVKRNFPESKATEISSYVVYNPLYFQQINTERYGWELGVFQPLVGTAQFYGDVLLLPYKVAANPPWKCEANAGYALPGDPEPLRFLTPLFSWKGVAGEVGAAMGGIWFFP
ncbi:MAG TPA: hypothetical protein PLN21_11050 [Gemmatales bacterium]|nr:hypothetical protein [Gemmatales bacterium]